MIVHQLYYMPKLFFLGSSDLVSDNVEVLWLNVFYPIIVSTLPPLFLVVLQNYLSFAIQCFAVAQYLYVWLFRTYFVQVPSHAACSFRTLSSYDGVHVYLFWDILSFCKLVSLFLPSFS